MSHIKWILLAGEVFFKLLLTLISCMTNLKFLGLNSNDIMSLLCVGELRLSGWLPSYFCNRQKQFWLVLAPPSSLTQNVERASNSITTTFYLVNERTLFGFYHKMIMKRWQKIFCACLFEKLLTTWSSTLPNHCCLKAGEQISYMFW